MKFELLFLLTMFIIMIMYIHDPLKLWTKKKTKE